MYINHTPCQFDAPDAHFDKLCLFSDAQAEMWIEYDICAPLLADLFLYSYEAEFVQKLLRDKNKKLPVSFNLTYRYIDDVLSINNHNFHTYIYAHLIYPDELEIKDTTESNRCASYLDFT